MTFIAGVVFGLIIALILLAVGFGSYDAGKKANKNDN